MEDNMFWVPDEKLSRNPRAAYSWNNDVLAGFKECVRNNQTSMALTYLVHVIDCLTAAAGATEAEPPQMKKPTAKKAAPQTPEEPVETQASA